MAGRHSKRWAHVPAAEQAEPRPAETIAARNPRPVPLAAATGPGRGRSADYGLGQASTQLSTVLSKLDAICATLKVLWST